MKVAYLLARFPVLATLLLLLSSHVGAEEASTVYPGAAGRALQSSAPAGSPSPQKAGTGQPTDPANNSPQGGSQSGTQSEASAGSAATKSGAVDIMVKDAYLFGNEDAAPIDRASAAIDDIIVVTVQGLQSLLNQSRCLDETGNRIPNCVEHPIALFIDSREIKSIAPEAVDLIAEGLHFHLQRTSENNEAWSDLLGAPPLDYRFFKRPAKVSVGLQDGSPVESSVRRFLIVRIDKPWFIAGFVMMALLIFVLMKLTLQSDLLRASGPPPVDANGNALRKAYSLSRFQMAFWFFLVVAAYCFIWLITGADDTITGSVLALIGIGSGTALGAAVVDINKDKAAPASRGFFKDVLSDADGVSFHRFQMFVWTLVLGVMFVSSVYYVLSMPEFSATLLALQGISAGTYLGFKIPEK
jgi:hypothetical protein